MQGALFSYTMEHVSKEINGIALDGKKTYIYV